MRPARASAGSFAALLCFGGIWGATLPLTKRAASMGWHPLGMLTWQLVIASGVLGIVVRWRRIPVPLSLRHLRWYAFVAAAGTLVPNTFSLLAYRHLPAAIMALIIATVPLLTLLVALGVGAERLDARRCGGIALGVAALALVALPDASLPGKDALPWVVLGLIAPLCYAIEGNAVVARTPAGLSPIAALFGASVLGAIVAGAVATVLGAHVDPFEPWTSVRWALAVSGIGNAIAYTGYVWLLQRTGAVFSSQIGYVVTLAGIAGGIAFLGERPAATVLLAVPLMLAGVALVRPRAGSAVAASTAAPGPVSVSVRAE